VRTTVEMKDEHRAKLLELAAKRREKGFSDILAEAIETYLAEVERSDERRRGALALRGSLSDVEADELREVAGRLRESWR
jgi:predicted transcriptional regulator